VIEGIIRVKWEAFGWRLLLLLLLEHLGFLGMVTTYLLLVVQENQVEGLGRNVPVGGCHCLV
jgi:hypothetical protein